MHTPACRRLLALVALTLLSCGVSLAQVTSSTARRFVTYASLPATCRQGDVLYRSSNNTFYGCTTANNWVTIQTGAAAGASAALDNLAAVAINTSLLPASAGSADLGSAAKPFGTAYVYRLIQKVVTLTDAATIATDASLGNIFEVTLAGNRTLGAPTNPVDGQRAIWWFIQDGTGSRTITLNSAFKYGTDITDITLSTGASLRDAMIAEYDATGTLWRIVGFLKGFDTASTPQLSGISSLGGLTGATQTFANDTNVTMTSSGTTHTLGWTGTLATARGGTGIAFFTAAGPTAARVYTFPDAAATILTTNAAVTVAQGGTGLASGTSGGIPYFSAATTIASSAALTANALVLGGGVGATPTVLGSLGTTTTVLHGNAAGAPTFGAVSLTADVSGVLPTANGGTGIAYFTAAGPTAARVYTFPDAAATILTVAPRVASTTSSATPTPNADTTDVYIITAQAEAAAFAAPTGTPVQGQKLIVRVKDNATARALTWNAIYRAGTDVTLPTTTVLSKTIYIGFIYNSTDTKWDLLAKADGY